MRNRIVASNAAAQIAGTEALADGGNATDAVLAAALAGVTLSTSSALLGSGLLITAGLGIGAYSVDGRARAPGLGMPRQTAPAVASVRDQIAVPALFEAILNAHNRFGTLSLTRVVQSAVRSVKEHTKDPIIRRRLKVVEALPKHGVNTLEALGIHQSMIEASGRVMDGVLTRDDLKPQTAPISELVAQSFGEHQVLSFMLEAEPRFAPPAPPPTNIGVAIAGDLHGAMAAMVWAEPDETVEVSTEYALWGARLNNAPTKGVTRRAAGSRIPLVAPVSIVRNERGAWGVCGASGIGAVEQQRDAMVQSRMSTILGSTIASTHGATEESAVSVGAGKGLAMWLLREHNQDLRAIEEAWERS